MPLKRLQLVLERSASKRLSCLMTIATSTKSMKKVRRHPDTLTTLKLRTIANVITGVTPNLKLTAWPKTACSITASGEEISNS